MLHNSATTIDDFFHHTEVVKRPQLVFLIWLEWQRTPPALPRKQRARLAATELSKSAWPGVTTDLVSTLVDHYRTVFENAAFDDQLLRNDGFSQANVLTPPTVCPCKASRRTRSTW